MVECIDRQVAIDQIKAEWAKLPLSETTGFGILMRVLTSIPAVDVRPVVYCKDCRHRDPEDHKCDCGQLERAGCIFPVDDDYFCTYGEKREES